MFGDKDDDDNNNKNNNNKNNKNIKHHHKKNEKKIFTSFDLSHQPKLQNLHFQKNFFLLQR